MRSLHLKEDHHGAGYVSCTWCMQESETGRKEGIYRAIPRIVHTDTGICMTGGHAWDEVEEADGPWAIRKEIRKQVRDGAEWVKILTTNREPYPELTQEELDAAVDECHRRGIKCGVHAGTNP